MWRRAHDIFSSLTPSEWFDAIVVTARDESQAAMYTKLIARLVARRRLPITKWIVLSDPANHPKIGPGGATLEALHTLHNTFGSLNHRFLLLHAGGYSQRLPTHAALGKAFATIPLPTDDGGCAWTMLEAKLCMIAPLVPLLPAGAFVACSDDLEIFSTDGLSFPSDGITALAHPGPLHLGPSHGVFLTHDGDGLLRRCKRFLHKCPEDELIRQGALVDGQILTDSAFFLPAMACERLLTVRNEQGGPVREEVDAYADFLCPLGTDADPPLGNSARARVGRSLLGVPLFAAILPHSEFYHFGTAGEFLLHCCESDSQFDKSTSLHRVLGNIGQVNATPGSCVMGCTVDDDVVVESGSSVEFSRLGSGSQVGRGCLVASVHLPPQIMIPDGVLIHTLPIGEGHVTQAMLISDNPKSSVPPGTSATVAAEQLSLGGRPFSSWISSLHLSAGDLWSVDDLRLGASIWNAAIMPVCESPSASLKCALAMLKAARGDDPSGWMPNAQRISMAVAVTKKRGHVLLADRDDAEAAGVESRMLAAFTSEADLSIEWPRAWPAGLLHQWRSALNGQGEVAWARALLERLERKLCTQGFALMRAQNALSHLISGWPWHGPTVECPDAFRLRFASQQTLQKIMFSEHTPMIPVQGERVQVSLPARVNLAGGWSDTPPYCLERGGTVLNLSVTVDDKFPVQATASRLVGNPVIQLHSVDGGAGIVTLMTVDELFTTGLDDPHALHRAVVAFALGLQAGSNASLQTVLVDGLLLETNVLLPKGTGLGTSSILVLACLRAIRGLTHLPSPSPDDEWNSVLIVEQLLTTGGGWQDQLGGGVPGIKITRTDPGVPQQYETLRLRLSPSRLAAFNDRFIVIYSGHQRLAKDRLTNVLDRWNARHDHVEHHLKQMVSLAEQMWAVLLEFASDECHDESAFAYLGHLYNQHKHAVFALEGLKEHPVISTVMDALAPFVHSSFVIGAGAGGFVMGFLRHGVSKSDAVSAVTAASPGSSQWNIKLWDSFPLRPRGTHVSAPGKVLISGGYVILDRPNSGIVLSTTCRLSALVQSDDSVAQDSFQVDSPPMSQSWQYKVEPSGTIVSESAPRNLFVEHSLAVVLKHVKSERLRAGLKITLFGDPAFYGNTKDERRQIPNSQIPKTGLGSSSAMVVSLIGALVLHALETPLNDEIRRLVHNLAQVAHCGAQGRVGSGFDVSAAVYGSHAYVRFSPSFVSANVVDAPWDEERRVCHLPVGITLMLGKVGHGSSTPSMVKAVRASVAQDDEKTTWNALVESTSLCVYGLERLASLLDDMGDKAIETVEQLACVSWDRMDQLTDDVSHWLDVVHKTHLLVRRCLRDLGEAAHVPIEPAPQTKLLDATMGVCGCLMAGVPGAGGYDAVFAVVMGSSARQVVHGLWKEASVELLSVGEGRMGFSLC